MNVVKIRLWLSSTACVVLLSSCSTLPPPAPAGSDSLSLTGSDIGLISDEMVTSMLASSALQRAGSTPRIILDKSYLRNNGYQAINKAIIINKLRAGLIQRAEGRFAFVSAGMAADYILSGTIEAIASANPSTGSMLRYHQFSFEILDIKSGNPVWSGLYETERKAVEDEIYR